MNATASSRSSPARWDAGRSVLRCPVRNCQLALTRDQTRVVCPRGHSFDIARSGYINLLQPQERRAARPGDTAAAVAARRRLHDQGVTEPLRIAVNQAVRASSSDTILDAGCGDGFYLGGLQSESGCDAHGVDISTPAIEAAARRYPECEWVVANADRALPFADGSFGILLSITARMNATEFRRVLRDDGRMLIALPAPDDLIELRGTGRDRVDRTLDTFATGFKLIKRGRVSTSADLDASAVADVLASIYRPLQPRPAEAHRVTLSLDLLLFQAA